jgi:hypothetical protein
MKGFIFYEGPSKLDGQFIVGIATLHSANRKTGDMIQTWILLRDTHPLEALRNGADASICGDCRHRQYDRAEGVAPCYVQVGRAPAGIWKAYQRGIYPALDPASVAPLLLGRGLRLGSYGDPAAIPAKAWRPLIDSAEFHTGYTHRAERPEAEWMKTLAMASADSFDQSLQLQARGWATFRVADHDAPTKPIRGEARCPASAEAGAHVQCFSCPIKCDGTAQGLVGRVINAH